MQAVVYVVVTMVDEVEESADFGEGERDEAPVDRWRGFLVRLVGWRGCCAG
ncbi:MAG: hypothetical protein ACRDRQ_04985 [Pseudonocardiaceae bacterium]